MGHRTRGELWAISCHFDPTRSSLRGQNFRRFRQALRVPLAVAELSFDGHFDLSAFDADILIQHRTSTVLWHKEALLMAVLRRLPPECRYVAWLDADVLFERPDWDSAAIESLAERPVVQLFDRVHHMPADWDEKNVGTTPEFEQMSLAAAIRDGADPRNLVDRTFPRDARSWAIGHAWAARRDLLERFGLYVGSIIGGGDTAFAAAALGHPGLAVAGHAMNPKQAAFYREWAEPFVREISGQVGTVSGHLKHLWHGSMEARRSRERHWALSETGFDPVEDLEADVLGCWRWRRRRPALASLMEEYFAGRSVVGCVGQEAAR